MCGKTSPTENCGIDSSAQDAPPEGLDPRFPPAWGEGVTWVSWAELDGVDWNAYAPRVDDRIHCYERGPDGAWTYAGKAGQSGALMEVLDGPAQRGSRYPEGTQWYVGGRRFRVERLRRCDAVPLDGEWRPVFDRMRALARTHGDDGVRLVVWFDS